MTQRHACDRGLTRRDLIRIGVAGGGAIALADRLGLAAPAKGAKTDVWVFHCEDKTKLMKACLKQIAESGGLGKDVKKLTLKINAAWWRTPAQGANTHPELADAFLKGCKDMGVKEIVMPEHPVDAAKNSFPKSGLLAVAKSNGVPMIDLGADKKRFKEVQIPKAVKLKTAMVGKDFLETDVLINMPVAKHHGGARMTCAMKNWMGAVQDRRFFHRNNLHQCIVDISTLLRPAWTIVDATRVMPDRGPKGPSRNLKTPHKLILCRDQVAVDVYIAKTFFAKESQRIRYLKHAAEIKLGTTDVSQMAIHEVEV